jgi:pSer/pThr/pTyr-binding forkhead associated (FHA) protein
MARQARLIERGPTPEKTRQVPLKPGEFLIGRGADCDLRLPDSAISRHHCIIRLTDDEAILLDLGSSNGTYLNGQRVRSQAALHSGDDIAVGTCHLLVDLGDSEAGNLGSLDANAGATTLKLRNPPPPAP